MTNINKEKIKQLLVMFSEEMFKAYNFSIEKDTIRKYKSKMVFPKYRDDEKTVTEKNVRVSEQEARFAFCNVLEKVEYIDFLYSVETPTQEEYSFSGKGKQSAMTDLTLYTDKNKILANIEFKAHSVDEPKIRKDFEKLIREDVPVCVFIQVFKNIDSGTINSFFDDKLNIAMQELENKKVKDKPFILCICCLKKETIHYHEFQNMNELKNCIDVKNEFENNLMSKKA